MLKRLLRKLALDHGKMPGLWTRLCHPNSTEYAEYLRRWGTFHQIGRDCHILPSTNVMDPDYVRLGDNVTLSGCTLIGHDGVVGVVQRAYDDLRVDSVGLIDIKDDCFVGWGAIILPGTTVGPRSIIGAGAVVKGIVPPYTVVAGNPARVICTWDDLVDKLKKQTESYPWASMIYGRNGDFDAAIEDELVRLRVAHWFNSEKNDEAEFAFGQSRTRSDKDSNKWQTFRQGVSSE